MQQVGRDLILRDSLEDNFYVYDLGRLALLYRVRVLLGHADEAGRRPAAHNAAGVRHHAREENGNAFQVRLVVPSCSLIAKSLVELPVGSDEHS